MLNVVLKAYRIPISQISAVHVETAIPSHDFAAQCACLHIMLNIYTWGYDEENEIDQVFFG